MPTDVLRAIRLLALIGVAPGFPVRRHVQDVGKNCEALMRVRVRDWASGTTEPGTTVSERAVDTDAGTPSLSLDAAARAAADYVARRSEDAPAAAPELPAR